MTREVVGPRCIAEHLHDYVGRDGFDASVPLRLELSSDRFNPCADAPNQDGRYGIPIADIMLAVLEIHVGSSCLSFLIVRATSIA